MPGRRTRRWMLQSWRLCGRRARCRYRRSMRAVGDLRTAIAWPEPPPPWTQLRWGVRVSAADAKRAEPKPRPSLACRQSRLEADAGSRHHLVTVGVEVEPAGVRRRTFEVDFTLAVVRVAILGADVGIAAHRLLDARACAPAIGVELLAQVDGAVATRDGEALVGVTTLGINHRGRAGDETDAAADVDLAVGLNVAEVEHGRTLVVEVTARGAARVAGLGAEAPGLTGCDVVTDDRAIADTVDRLLEIAGIVDVLGAARADVVVADFGTDAQAAERCFCRLGKRGSRECGQRTGQKRCDLGIHFSTPFINSCPAFRQCHGPAQRGWKGPVS